MNGPFLHNAFGLALGGTLTSPTRPVQIETQAATSLGVGGGESTATVPNGYEIPGILSFSKATTKIFGGEISDGVFNTTVSVSVEGVRILAGAVTARALDASISSTRDRTQSQPEITASASFTDLVVDSRRIAVRLDADMSSNLPTYKSMRDKFETSSNYEATTCTTRLWRKTKGSLPVELVPHMPQPKTEKAEDSTGILFGSLAQELVCDEPVLTTFYHCIEVPSVGYLFLAELATFAEARRLTMMRFELTKGSYTGRLVLAECFSNGTVVNPFP